MKILMMIGIVTSALISLAITCGVIWLIVLGIQYLTKLVG